MTETTKKTTAKTKTGPKKPADHQAKKPKVTVGDDGYTVTLDGRDWFIANTALDDFELLGDLGEIDAGNANRLPSVLRRLLGPVQYQQVLAQMRDKKTGQVSVEAGAQFVADLLKALPSS